MFNRIHELLDLAEHDHRSGDTENEAQMLEQASALLKEQIEAARARRYAGIVTQHRQAKGFAA